MKREKGAIIGTSWFISSVRVSWKGHFHPTQSDNPKTNQALKHLFINIISLIIRGFSSGIIRVGSRYEGFIFWKKRKPFLWRFIPLLPIPTSFRFLFIQTTVKKVIAVGHPGVYALGMFFIFYDSSNLGTRGFATEWVEILRTWKASIRLTQFK